MKKQRAPSSNTKVPDLLSAFVRGNRLHGGKRNCLTYIKQTCDIYNTALQNIVASQTSLKELLMSQLPPPQCQADFVPLITKLGESNESGVKVNKVPASYSDSDGHKQIEEMLDKNFTTVEDTEAVKCLNCLMNDITLSFDGKWLKSYFQVPLKMAIKEIVAKKPYDPVNYLGFWLLNYRKCQENKQWQLEADHELHYYRSLIPEPVLEVEEQISIDKGEEEEIVRDWNFKYYDSVHSTV